MAASRWMFTREQLLNTPSRKNGIDADKELSYRQQAANLIQDMGQRLQVEQLCINTAIVYMHRFYMFRSFTRFPRNDMAPACLFLAAKVEEQPRKLEHVIKVAHACLNRDHNTPTPDPKTEAYLEQAQQLVINENILLQTLGFEVTVDHPHTHVVKASTVILAKASKDLSKTSYYLATNSLHMTTLCLQYRPTIVACVCIYMACRWANYMIPRSNEGREWFQYVDQQITTELIEELYNEFLNILNKSPMKLKRKIMGWKGSGSEVQAREEERLGLGSSHPDRSSAAAHSKHSNHDRRDGPEPGKHARPERREGPESVKHSHPDLKQSHEHKEMRLEQRKDHHQEKRPTEHKSGQSSHQPDRKPHVPHQTHPKPVKREDRRDVHAQSQQHRKEPQHSIHVEEKPVPHEHHNDAAPLKKEMNINGRTIASTAAVPPVKSHHDVIKINNDENKDSPDDTSDTQETLPLVLSMSDVSQSSAQPGMPPRSKTAIDFNQYLKRKEHERLEREKHIKQRAAETGMLNNTFSEGSNREHGKHRPPKLDISLPVPENHVDHKSVVNNREKLERPYNVNIKSPIKPHRNITVKSPIKSSDLKQPKLELAKVQITPEKDGGDPLSVNINTDPAIRRLIKHDKQEPESSTVESAASEQDNIPLITMEPVETSVTESTLEIKHDIKDEPELEPGEIFEPDTNLDPEHTVAPDFKSQELNYHPDQGLDSAAAMRLAAKPEPNSAPAVVSRIKVEPNNGANTPIKLKISTQSSSSGNSPLKLKISTKGIATDSDHSSKHNSPHRHKHKHKDKHKHKEKHSREKDRHREKHREKCASAGASAAGANGQSTPLKMSFKLSDIQSEAGASNEHWSVKNKHDKHKHRASVSDPTLIKNNNDLEAERQQPWSMTDLITKSGSAVAARSPTRKRRRTPTVDQSESVEKSSHPKAAKMVSNRIRRSSSSHSVVSMELSDGEEKQTNGPQEQNTLNLLNLNLMQAIAQTKQKVESLQRTQEVKRSQSTRNSPRDIKPPGSRQQSRNSPRDIRPSVNRQQSGFDLEGMMWAGSGASDVPPLPHSHRTPPPPPPDQTKPPPPLSR